MLHPSSTDMVTLRVYLPGSTAACSPSSLVQAVQGLVGRSHAASHAAREAWANSRSGFLLLLLLDVEQMGLTSCRLGHQILVRDEAHVLAFDVHWLLLEEWSTSMTILLDFSAS